MRLDELSNFVRVYLPLLGYLGVDIFGNKTLNSHVGPMRSHEEFFVQWSVWLGIWWQWVWSKWSFVTRRWWVWVENHALSNSSILGSGSISSSVYNKHCLPPTKLIFCLHQPIQAPLIGLCCQEHHRGSTEIRATLLTNQIAVFRIGRLWLCVIRIIQVPVGRFAYMPGQLYHTNEILVLLGDNWFTKRTAQQAKSLAERRKICES